MPVSVQSPELQRLLQSSKSSNRSKHSPVLLALTLMVPGVVPAVTIPELESTLAPKLEDVMLQETPPGSG